MAEETTEQNKSEDATPFKLQRARQRGMVARGRDLGFVSVLVGAAIVAQMRGAELVSALSQAMRTSLVGLARSGSDPQAVRHAAGDLSGGLAIALLLPGLILMAICATVEVGQNRGVTFSWEPLQPDFSRLNPATGLKRLFSAQMLKEAGKSVLKFAVYTLAAVLFVRNAAMTLAARSHDPGQLVALFTQSAGRLLLMFILLAAGLAIVDQLLARGEFARRMRMSRRELTREMREREGEPRIKKKRRQLLRDIVSQARAATEVKGADIVVVNPTHYAVALRYRPEQDEAPVIHARGRNAWALRMREAARREGIAIVHNPSLARSLFNQGRLGKPIGRDHFVAVADIYITLRRVAGQRAGAQGGTR
jgi:flagellar biosynthesis protein FlhB